MPRPDPTRSRSASCRVSRRWSAGGHRSGSGIRLRRSWFSAGSSRVLDGRRAGLAATPRQPALAPWPDAVGDLPPLSRTASLATALGRQTGVPVRARPGPPRAIADWYITVRGGPPPLRQRGPFSLPGKITNVTIFHEPVRCSRCPIEPGLPFAGRGVRRLCELVDPTHPAYNPAYLTLLRPKVDVHTLKANVQYTTLDRKPLKPVRNRHQTNTILNTSHEPKSTTVLELKYRSYEMFTIIQEFTEKYRGFRGSLFSIHPHSGCERLLAD